MYRPRGSHTKGLGMLVNINIIFWGFFENFTYPLLIIKGRMTTHERSHRDFVVDSLILSLSILVKSVEDKMQLFDDSVDNIRG